MENKLKLPLHSTLVNHGEYSWVFDEKEFLPFWEEVEKELEKVEQLEKEIDWFVKKMIDCPPVNDCPKGYAMPCKWYERRECWRELARNETRNK